MSLAGTLWRLPCTMSSTPIASGILGRSLTAPTCGAVVAVRSPAASSKRLTNPTIRCSHWPLPSLVTRRRRRAKLALFIAAVVALVATSALFVTNRFRWFVVSYASATEFRNLTVSNGAVWYGWSLSPAFPGSEGWGAASVKRMSPQDSNFDPLRLWPVLSRRPKNTVFAIPLWMVALPSAVAAICLASGLRRRASQCECGYSLAGLPEEAPCPECGRARVGTGR